MKYQIILDVKPDHCLRCPLRNREDDGCALQVDGDGESIEVEDWKEQMENCPIKEVEE